MAKRSLHASLDGIQQAKRAFNRKGWTQENLAGEVNLKTRQPVWRFFTGRPIERHTFLELCSVLELDWRAIAANPPAEFVAPGERAENADIDLLVQRVRSQRQGKIQDQCGTLQLLDINRPVSLDDIYIDVNILEEIPSQQWLDLSDLQNLTAKEFDRVGLGEVALKQVAGISTVETYPRLRVLGKPGSGKTTFLQHLAIQCNQGNVAANRVPIFITLRDFADESRATAEFSLLDYIQTEFLTSGISERSLLETLLHHGRVLLLLDGLDEVRQPESRAIVNEIRRFSENYPKNLFVVACRTAAKSFTIQRFTDVEIAPFTAEQIAAFAQKWFAVLTRAPIEDELAVQFMQNLDLPENLQFRRLVVTPLFLHLACWVFHRQEKFPTKNTQFYKQCLDLLLGKWDESRGIQRDEVYRGFLLPQKLRLMSQIAAATFEQGHHFFEQQEIEHYISDYIRNLPNAPTEPEELQLDSESILKAIELQHGLLAERVRGIFSFSYLAFQEYFMARKIVASHNLQALEQALERLVSHITDPRWREIFLLTAAMLRSADSLVQLMKQQIDAIVAQDPYLQEFLTWASRKSLAPPAPAAATRAFYLALTRSPHLTSHFALACTLDQGMFLDAALNDLVLQCAMDSSPDFAHAHACADALSNALVIVLDIGLHQSLQHLKDQLPPAQEQERFQTWWQANHRAWTEQLRGAIAEHRNIQHQWYFSPDQQQVLQRYYDANQLLLDCLNSHCEVTDVVRQEIEAALLLPQQELEDREWRGD
jgi:predicted NACHT family NTPase